MPALLSPEVRWVEDQAPRKKITREEAQVLADNGFLTTRWELLDGEIVLKMPQNAPHGAVLDLIALWLESLFGRLYVRMQRPVEVAQQDQKTNYPEPDVFVMTQPTSAFFTRHPLPNEIVVVVEISDTTLRDDRKTKAALYSRAGIIEYWVADVNTRQIIIHLEPTANGYNSIETFGEDEKVSTLTKPDAEIAVSALFPADDAE